VTFSKKPKKKRPKIGLLSKVPNAQFFWCAYRKVWGKGLLQKTYQPKGPMWCRLVTQKSKSHFFDFSPFFKKNGFLDLTSFE